MDNRSLVAVPSLEDAENGLTPRFRRVLADVREEQQETNAAHPQLAELRELAMHTQTSSNFFSTPWLWQPESHILA